MCNGREFQWLEMSSCRVAWDGCNTDLILIKEQHYGQAVLICDNTIDNSKGAGGAASFKFKPSVHCIWSRAWMLHTVIGIFQFLPCRFLGWWVLINWIASPRGRSNQGLPKASSSQVVHGKFQRSVFREVDMLVKRGREEVFTLPNRLIWKNSCRVGKINVHPLCRSMHVHVFAVSWTLLQGNVSLEHVLGLSPTN